MMGKNCGQLKLSPAAMAEFIVIGLFCLSILACATAGVTVVAALLFGLVIFAVYGIHKGVGLPALARAGMQSARNAVSVVVLLLLIGMLSGSWRASGTIAWLVDVVSGCVAPSTVLLTAFLSNALLSMLIGSSFATAASMGIVSMTMATAMGIPAILAGGAVLSGIYVGDRNSPLSSSAMLVCAVTGTDIYGNVRLMVRTSAVPFFACCIIYGLAGLALPSGGAAAGSSGDLFASEFVLTWHAMIPAAAMLALIAVRVPIRIVFVLSIACAAGAAVLLQGQSFSEAFLALLLGYRARNPEVGAMMNGGGLVSMVNVCCIITVASTYIGIFRLTGLLRGIEEQIPVLAAKITPMGAAAAVGLVSSAVACNQVFSVMLTKELCREIIPDRRELAIVLEDTSIVMSPLFPWSIACAVPLATIGAPALSVLAACFLYFLPLWMVAAQSSRRKLFRKQDAPDS